jgi:hypothetical protein
MIRDESNPQLNLVWSKEFAYTFDEFHPPTSTELAELPTLATGQTEDLKLEGPHHRWWLSRCGPEDGATHRVSCERLVRGRWVISGEFEPFALDSARGNRCSHEGCHVPATRIVSWPPGKRGYSCGNHEADKPQEAT